MAGDLSRVRPISQGLFARVAGPFSRRAAALALLCLLVTGFWGCAGVEKSMTIPDLPGKYSSGTILSMEKKAPVSFDGLISALLRARVIYVGETHTAKEDHAVQLAIIKALYEYNPDIVVGMEMFDMTYQPVLTRWSAGELDEQEFVEKTHWYANWRYDYALYRDILAFVREKGLRLVGLNLPFHIPAKIRVGGIANLRPGERRYLPDDMDLTNEAHREYVKSIFEGHPFRRKENFDYFYEAQAAWEETMAESVAENLGEQTMVVLAGNGHIIHKFGIPERVYRRNRLPFKTVYPVAVDKKIDAASGDYIWITP